MKDLTDLQLVRVYPVSVERLWYAVTQNDQFSQWFGPEGTEMVECDANLSSTGPWGCVMIGHESGRRYKLTGQVTHVRPPEDGSGGSVGFTWAWHDDDDERGPESHVTFTVEPDDGGARLILDHRDLADAERAKNHRLGWEATLPRLERLLSA